MNHLLLNDKSKLITLKKNIRKIKNVIWLMVFTLLNQLTFGQNLLTQDFNFTGNITANGWVSHSSGGTNPISTTSGLVFTNYAGSNAGNAVQIGNAGGEDDNISFAAQNTNGQSVYIAFMANINDAATSKTGDYFFHIGSPGGAAWTAFAGRVFAKIVAGNVNFGLSNTSTGAYGTTNFQKNTTYLLVVKYTINTAGNDTTSLWVIPSGVPASELLAGAPELTSTSTAGTDAINSIGLRQGSSTNSSQVIVDGIRVGLTWSDAVQSGTTPANPLLSSGTLTSFGNVCVNTTVGPNKISISGSNLTAGNLKVGPLTGYTFSKTSGGTFADSLLISQVGGSFNDSVFVKFNPTTVQSYNGNIFISGGGATAITVAAVGSGVSATSITTGAASSVTPTGVTLNGTLIQGCSAVTAYGIEYSTTNNFTPGTGTAVASTNVSGSAYTVALTGLLASTTYYYVSYATTGSGTIYGTQSSFTTSTPQVAATGVVISQIYGGGSNVGATYNADFVELHNNSNSTQDISGHKLLYGSANGLLGTTITNRFIFPANTTIPAGGYLLIAASAGLTGANLPVFPDYNFTLTLSGTNGKIAFGTGSMIDSTSYALQPSGSVLDFVGYGSTASESETSPISTSLSATTAAFRNNNGCDDTNNNSADFTVQTPLPRNSFSPLFVCGITPANPVLTSSVLNAFGAVCVNSTVGPNKVVITGVNLNTENIKVGPLSGYKFSSTSGGIYADSLLISQTGGSFNDSVFVKFNPTAAQSYNGNITILGGGATAITVAASGSGVSATAVTTGAASSITTSSATINNTLIQGCNVISNYGVVYSLNNGFNPSSGIFSTSTNLSASDYSDTLTGLNASTTYYYIAFAISGTDTLYGTQSSFTTNTPSTGNASIVISQLYGAGGNPGSLFNADYVELHNTSNTTQTISNYSIQYASASATGTWSGRSKLPAISIPAGGYYLIQMSAVGSAGVALPTPDYISSPTISMSQTNGRVALVSDTISLTACPATPNIVDLVGYGGSVCFETAAVPALDTIHAGFRNNNGCDDTNNNLADFTLNTPAPRNSASPVFICGTLPTTPTLTAGTLTSFGGVCINTTAGPNSITLNGTNLVSGDLSVAALTGFSYSLTSGGTYTSTLTIPQTGGTLTTTTIYVKFNPTAVQSYNGNITISGGGANAINVATVGFGVSTTSVSSGSATVITTSGATINGSLTQGCTIVTSYGVVYSTTNGFTPASGTFLASTNLSGAAFSTVLTGLAPSTTYYYVTYAISGADTLYGIQSSFTTNTPSTGGSGVKISQIYGGGGSASGTFNADFVEIHNNGSSTVDISGHKIMYGSSGGNLGSTSSNIFTFPAGVTIPAGAYILVATTAGTGLASLPVTPDYTFTLTLSGTNGKIAFGTADMLANTTYALQPAGSVLDFVGYGTANESETTATPALSSTTAGFRNNGGCDDTDNNLADFTVATPLPRNSASPVNLCNSVPSGPTLFGGTLTGFGAVAVGTNSNSQSFNLSGSNLTGAPGVITVTAPNYFMVSIDNVNWSSTLNVNYADSTLASTTIYVMFAPQTIGIQAGNISISGGGATSINVAVTGNGVTTSVITVSSIAGFGEVCINSIAGPNSFDISGANFTTDNLVVGPLAGYTFSTASSGPYSSTLTITQSGGSFAQTIYVQFKPTAELSYNGNIPVSGAGANASANVAISGSGKISTGTVVSGDSISISPNVEIVGGEIIDTGCTSVIAYGIEYSGIASFIPGTGTKAFSSNINNNKFTSRLTGLVQNSAYYYRAFVTNTGGTAYGEQKMFFTPALADGFTVNPTPLKTGGNVHYTLSNIKPGHYEIKLINALGQLAFQKETIIQVNFMDDNFVLPSNIPAGMYFFQIASPEFRIQKPIVVIQ